MSQQRSNKPKQHTFKIVLLGESAVGKSSLVTRFVRDQFDKFKESTIGAAFLTKDVVLDKDNTANLHIWDTAGQERYKSLAPMYYRNAAAAVVVYDITQTASFGRAKAWVRELQKQADSGIVIALAGNKTDLEDSRSVSREEGEMYAESEGLMFFETSAQSGANVADVFMDLAKKVPRTVVETGPARGSGQGGQGINLRSEDGGNNTSGDCAC